MREWRGADTRLFEAVFAHDEKLGAPQSAAVTANADVNLGAGGGLAFGTLQKARDRPGSCRGATDEEKTGAVENRKTLARRVGVLHCPYEKRGLFRSWCCTLGSRHRNPTALITLFAGNMPAIGRGGKNSAFGGGRGGGTEGATRERKGDRPLGWRGRLHPTTPPPC